MKKYIIPIVVIIILIVVFYYMFKDTFNSSLNNTDIKESITNPGIENKNTPTVTRKVYASLSQSEKDTLNTNAINNARIHCKGSIGENDPNFSNCCIYYYPKYIDNLLNGDKINFDKYNSK